MGVPSDNRLALAAARQLTLEGTAARVMRAMNDAGVRCLLLKGPTLSDLYDGVRQYSDIDLLVAPETTRTAEGALIELGFVLRDDDPHSRIWWRRGVDVDLHSTLVGVQAELGAPLGGSGAPQPSGSASSATSASRFSNGPRARLARRVARRTARTPGAEAARGSQKGTGARSRGHVGRRRATRRRARRSGSLLDGARMEPAGRELQGSLELAKRARLGPRRSCARRPRPRRPSGCFDWPRHGGPAAGASSGGRHFRHPPTFARGRRSRDAAGPGSPSLTYGGRSGSHRLVPALAAIMRARRAARG